MHFWENYLKNFFQRFFLLSIYDKIKAIYSCQKEGKDLPKIRYYAVRYLDKTGVIVTTVDDYKKSTKGFSGSSSRVFKSIEEAKEWLLGYDFIIKKEKVPLTKTPDKKTYYAIAVGRIVDVTKDKELFLKATKNYSGAKYKKFISEEQGWEWLAQNGFSKENKKGIYAVAKGRRTGIYRYFNTYHRQIYRFSGGLGAGGFQTMEDAEKWLKRNRNNQGKEYFAIAYGKRTGVFSSVDTFKKNCFSNNSVWTNRGFTTKREAVKWLEARRKVLAEIKDKNTIEAILAYERKKLPIVYIDGSYNDQKRKYGCSVIVSDSDGSVQTFTKSRKKNTNSTYAEVEALLLALQIMTLINNQKEFILVHDFDQLPRITDKNYYFKSVDQLIQNKIKSIITDEEVTTHFLCVKSHSGLFGNEIADHYAKESVKKLDELKKMSKNKNAQL